MTINPIQDRLAVLEAQLKQANQLKNEPAQHSARQLYFELQRLTHQYAQVKPATTAAATVLP